MTDDISQAEPMLVDSKLFPWWIMLLWGILTIIVGLMFLINPSQTMIFLITFLGAYWLVSGLFTIASLCIDRSNMGWKIFLSVINILAGILILMHPFYATFFAFEFLIIFIGFWACFIGAAHMYQAFTTKDAGNGVLGIISIIFGLLLLFNTIVAIVMLPYFFGGFALISGLASIYVAIAAKGLQNNQPA